MDPNTKLIKSEELGELVFKDEKARRLLTAGTGKFIFLEIGKQLIKYIAMGEKLILVDAPILFETKILEYVCYPVVVIWADEEVQVQRLATRNKFPREEALRRIRSQMPNEIKVKKATIAVKNQDS